MKKENILAYEVLKQENLTDIHSTGYLVRHKKTGARLVLIENMMRIRYFPLPFVPRRRTALVFHIFWNIVFCAAPASFR